MSGKLVCREVEPSDRWYLYWLPISHDYLIARSENDPESPTLFTERSSID